MLELTKSVEQALNVPNLSPLTQKKCLKLLYRTCGCHTLLPSALKVQAHYDHTSHAPYHGGFGDVWKGEFDGQDVAVKVIRIYSNIELCKIVNVCHRLHFVTRYCVLTVLFRGSARRL